MSFNPLLLAIPIGAYFLMKKPSKPVKNKDVKVDQKPAEIKTGFTLTKCNELVIVNEDQFQEYNKKILDELINTKPYENPLNTSAMKFAKEYLQKFSKTCADITIEDKNQFLIVYAILLKGVEFFIDNKFVKADRWKKYFSNEVELDFYITSQENDFVKWAESIELKETFEQDELEKLKLVFEIEELPTLDKGFQYDCSSIKITNEVRMLSYFEKLAKIIANAEEEFSNPSLISLKKFAEFMLYVISTECHTKYEKGELNDYERVIVLKLFDLFIKSYMNAMIGVKEEIDLYKANYANEQWIFILQDFNIPEAALIEFDSVIKEKGMYP